MKLILNDELVSLLEEQLRDGYFLTPEEAILAGLRALKLQQMPGAFLDGEMESLLEQGERSGEPLNGEAVLQELRDLRHPH